MAKYYIAQRFIEIDFLLSQLKDRGIPVEAPVALVGYVPVYATFDDALSYGEPMAIDVAERARLMEAGK